MKSAHSDIQRPVKKACLWAFLGVICASPWLNSAGAGVDQVPIHAQSNSATSASTDEMLLNAAPGVPHNTSNSLSNSAVTLAVATNLNPPAATNVDQLAATNRPGGIEGHKLAVGDSVIFRIVEDEDEPKILVVTDSGDLEVPYIGLVPAENKTCKQLAAEIKAALEKDYYYHATVIIALDVMAKSHGRVYLVGAVRLAGPVEIPSDEPLTLSKAILRAGGFTDYADRRHVKVTRKGAMDKTDKETFIVNVGAIFDKGNVELDLPLQSGDLIFIPDRLIRF